MLKVGWLRSDMREVGGQLSRVVAAALFSRIWVPDRGHKEFALVEARRESHTTPGGSVQRFAYALLRKRAD